MTERIFTNAKIDDGDGNWMKGGIGLQVTGQKGTCEKCHFIQFMRACRIDKSKNEDDSMFRARTFRKYGSWYLDAIWRDPESVWYDTYGNGIRDDHHVGIYDFPDVPDGRPDDVTVGQEFQTFLVCDGKVKWKWTWKREQTKGDDGSWGPDHFVPISGAAATDLGDFNGKSKFPMGYIDEAGSNPVPPYANPIK